MSFLSEKVGEQDWVPFYERYGWIFRGRGNNRLICCPMHGEKNPSLSVNVRTSLYKCHACPAQGDAITYLVNEQGQSEHDAIEEVKRFFNITDDTPVQTAKSRKAEKAKVYPQEDDRIAEWHEALVANPDRVVWLKANRGIDFDTIRTFKIGWSEKHGRYSFPIKTSKGIIAIKLYLPDATKEQVKWIHADAGSEIGLYPERRITTSERVVICEGELDALLTNQMGIAAVTGTGGAGSWKQEWCEAFKDKSVVIVYDNDEAGRNGAEKVSRALIGHAKDSTIVKLPVDKAGGDLTDYFHGDKATVDDFWELVGSTTPAWRRDTTEMGPTDIRDAAKAMQAQVHLYAMMDAKQARQLSERPAFLIGELVWTFLNSFGTFYIDASMAAQVGEKLDHIYFFNRDTKALWPMSSQKFESMLFDYTKINSKESDFSKLIGHLQGRCVAPKGAASVRIYKVAFYDEGLKKAYVYRGQNRMYVLDGEQLPYEADNGTDGILFAETDKLDYWHPDFEYKGEPILEMFSAMRLENTELTDKQMQLLLAVYTVGIVFPTLQPTRLIPMFIGEMGSGKTYTSRMVGWLWSGPGKDYWDVATVEENKEEDFITTLANQHIVCADNLDNRISWMQDLIARVATGAEVKRRALYTNGKIWSAPLSSWLMITSREPKWIKREDVVQRLLPIHFKENKSRRYIAEGMLTRTQKELRPARLGNMLNIANGVVKQLRAGAVPQETSLRIADFAFIGQLIANAMGHGDEFKEAVEKLPREQRRFMSHDHPILEAVEEWLARGNRGREVDFQKFFEELQEIGGWNDRRGMRTWKGLLEKMKEMKDTIEGAFSSFVIERNNMSGKLQIQFLSETDERGIKDSEAKVGETIHIPF